MRGPFLAEPQVKTLALLQLILLVSLGWNAAWISWDLLAGLYGTQASSTSQAGMSAAVVSGAKKTATEMVRELFPRTGSTQELTLSCSLTPVSAGSPPP